MSKMNELNLLIQELKKLSLIHIYAADDSLSLIHI